MHGVMLFLWVGLPGQQLHHTWQLPVEIVSWVRLSRYVDLSCGSKLGARQDGYMFHDPFENYKSSIVYLTKRVVQLLTCREHNMKNSARPFLSFEHFNNLLPIKLFLRLGRIVVLRPKDAGATIAELHKDTIWLNFFDNLFMISNTCQMKS